MLLFVLNKIIVYYRQKLEAKEENLIYSRILLILEFIIKYVIILVGFILMLIIIFAALGFEDVILSGVGDFFLTKSGFIFMLALLVIIAVSIQRFSKSFFTDMRKRPGTKKLSPGMMFILEKTLKIGLYVILATIAIFTILSAMGLGELGQTIILMMSVIIGFVVSMAATGSIGNALSGLVLYGFKPIEKGDMVTLTVGSGNVITGTVVNIDLMFTTLKDLDSQEVRIPNNDVLSYNIVNHTRSEQDGFAVAIDATIGYDVPADKVKDLMRKAAIATNGVLKEPKPFVLLTQFHNHAIEYRLRAFIKNAKAMYPIRSAIMNRMQKNFYRDGIEILSPVYEVGRRDEIPDSKTVRDRFVTAVERDEADEDLGDDDGTIKAFAGFAALEAIEGVQEIKVKPPQETKKKETPPPPPDHKPKKKVKKES
jgi:small-conductance mechanosensitive channel